ncbi:hypothetical protein [Streptomyces sp. SAI-208]|uniref:hypothetical protein n=1 Tax=Streptomyces sp. SAI-208 TaxID=2940550 RepID=UPI002474B325|nr:hypothetical protein [Streptomyces sp. SAI-208]
MLEGLLGIAVLVRGPGPGLLVAQVLEPVRQGEQTRAGGGGVGGLHPPDHVEEILVASGVLQCQPRLADAAEAVDGAGAAAARGVHRAEDRAQQGQFLAPCGEVRHRPSVEVGDEGAEGGVTRFDLADDVGGRVLRQGDRAGLVQARVDGGRRVVGRTAGQRQHLAAGPPGERWVVVRGHQGEDGSAASAGHAGVLGRVVHVVQRP